MNLVVITLSTDLEKLVQDRIARGEFENAEAVVEFALRRFLDSAGRLDSPLTPRNGPRHGRNSLRKSTAIRSMLLLCRMKP